MTYIGTTDYLYEVSAGRVSGKSTVHKFGYALVGTSLTPVCYGGVYQTPTALTSLEMLSSSANDTSAGSGAQTVFVQGIGTGWAETSETLTLNGTTAVALANQYFRIYRMYVVTSGTYATSAAGSHAGTITLRTSGAGATWASLPLLDSFPIGQSLIGAYSVATGKTVRILSSAITVDSTKTVDALFFYRPTADDVSSPYGSIRLQNIYTGLSGSFHFTHRTNEAYVGPCDIGFMGKTATGTGSATVEFELALEAV